MRQHLPILSAILAAAWLWVVYPCRSLNAQTVNSSVVTGVDSLRRAADMCFARHRYARADSLYRLVLRSDSLNAPVTALLASCMMRTGNYCEAVAIYQRALNLDPTLRLCYLGLVTCCYKLGEIEKAATWASRVRRELSGAERRDWDKLVKEMFPLIAKDGD